jgi:hypothetical protein
VREFFQVWQHRDTGECYSVRLQWDEWRKRPVITGVCGPTDPSCLPHEGGFLGFYQGGSYVSDLEARRDEFTILVVPPSRVRY